MAEGPATAMCVAAMLGSWWLWHRTIPSGAGLLATSLTLLIAVRYSTAILLAGALALAGVIAIVATPSLRHWATYTMVAINAAAASAAITLAKALHWPGVGESLQDTFTVHFARPDVADPWRSLAALNWNYWTQWIQLEARTPWLLLALALGTWALFRRNPPLAWLTVAVGATGVATQIAHPVNSQGERLMAHVWIVVATGLPLLLDLLMTTRCAAISLVFTRSDAGAQRAA